MQNQHSYVMLRSGATKNLYTCPNSPDLGQNETLRSPLHFVQGFGSGWHKFKVLSSLRSHRPDTCAVRQCGVLFRERGEPLNQTGMTQPLVIPVKGFALRQSGDPDHKK